jgi:hypothetical protein
MMAEAPQTHWLMRAFDPLLALMLAAATAFAIYAMPGAVLDRLVGQSGLPGLLPAAAAPLGATARVLLAVTGAILMGVISFLILRAVGAVGAPKPIRLRAQTDVPELRRADAHPDAPARRPIFATLDLGKSLDDGAIEVISKGWPAPIVDREEPAESVATFDVISEAPEASTLDVPERAQPAPAPEVETPEPVAEAPPPPPPTPAIEDDSVAGLMARLEAGLARRDTAAAPIDRLPDENWPMATGAR